MGDEVSHNLVITSCKAGKLNEKSKKRAKWKARKAVLKLFGLLEMNIIFFRTISFPFSDVGSCAYNAKYAST